MKSTYTLGVAATVFIILGLVLLNNVLPAQKVLSSSVVGFAVANEATEQTNDGVISNINGFFVRGNLAPDVREKYLPIYILLNILFIISIIMTFYKKYKR